MSWLLQFYWNCSEPKQTVMCKKILKKKTKNNQPDFFAVFDSKVLEFKTKQMRLFSWEKRASAYSPRVWICESTGFSVGQNDRMLWRRQIKNLKPIS